MAGPKVQKGVKAGAQGPACLDAPSLEGFDFCSTMDALMATGLSFLGAWNHLKEQGLQPDAVEIPEAVLGPYLGQKLFHYLGSPSEKRPVDGNKLVQRTSDWWEGTRNERWTMLAFENLPPIHFSGSGGITGWAIRKLPELIGGGWFSIEHCAELREINGIRLEYQLRIADCPLLNRIEKPICVGVLRIQSMERLQSVVAEAKKVVVENAHQLQSLQVLGPELEELRLGGLSDLRSLSWVSRHLRKAEFIYCPALADIPLAGNCKVGELSLRKCGSLRLFPAKLVVSENLRVTDCESFENFGPLKRAPRVLTIENVPAWNGELPRDRVTLRQLLVRDAPGFRALPEGLVMNQDKDEVYLQRCPFFQRLPESLSVKDLKVFECPSWDHQLGENVWFDTIHTDFGQITLDGWRKIQSTAQPAGGDP